MAQKKRHTKDEIFLKLRQAEEMAGNGKLQSEIASALGISVMTLHRWRKGANGNAPVPVAIEAARFGQELGIRAAPLPLPAAPTRLSGRVDDLQLENSRLRRLVTDLLLERMKLAEEMQANMPAAGGMKQSAQ